MLVGDGVEKHRAYAQHQHDLHEEERMSTAIPADSTAKTRPIRTRITIGQHRMGG